MKKAIIALSTLSLATLPIVTIASCSATTPSEEATLKTEVAKFNKSLVTKQPEVSALMAAKTINDAPKEQKLAELEKIVNVPKISKGFQMQINTVVVEENPKTSISVEISVTEMISDTTEKANLIVTGLVGKVSSASLEVEAAKFTPAKNKVNFYSSANGVINIIKAKSQAEKLKQLKIIATVPTLSEGIEMIINSPNINTKLDTSVDYLITLVDVSAPVGSNTKDIIFTVEGFKKPELVEGGLVRLYKQAELLVDKEIPADKKTQTATEAATLLNADTFAQYYPPITLANNYSYRWAENRVVGDTIVVKTFVRSTSQSQEWFITLTGFKPAA